MFPDYMALDRALDRLPKDRGGIHARLTDALTDDAIEDGVFPKFDSIKTVGDVRRLGVDGIVEIAKVSASDAGWLVEQFGGAQALTPLYDYVPQLVPSATVEKPKRGWPKGKPRKAKAA